MYIVNRELKKERTKRKRKSMDITNHETFQQLKPNLKTDGQNGYRIDAYWSDES